MSKKLNLSASEINTLYPISGADIYSRALVLRRNSNQKWGGVRLRGKRGKVIRLSARSRTNFVLTVMRSNVRFRSLLILSYGLVYPKSGKIVKKQLNRFLIALKRLYPGVKYFWFIEFQRRGAPHFNIGLTLEDPANSDRLAVATAWARIVAVGDFDKVVAVNSHPQQWGNFRELDGALRYIVAYATKPHQKTVPLDYQDTGRFWGMSRVKCPEQPKVAWGSESDVREYLAACGRDFDNWELLPKIIFV